MVDLTPTNEQAAREAGGIITSQQPRTSVTPGEVARPYADLGNALDKTGEALGTLAEEQAKLQGFKAVTRDAAGNIQVEQSPIVGPASQAYARSVKFAALADGEADAKQQDIGLRQKFRDDPQSYLAAADAFKQEKVKQYTDAAGPEVGLTLGKTIDATTTQTYRGLLNEHERLTLQRADASIAAGINSAKDDATALARGGDTSSPAFVQAVDKVHTLTQEKVNNPRLAYPKEAAAYDLDQFHGELAAQGFLYHVDQTYKNAPSKAEGAQAALNEAKTVLTDPSMKLTEVQRQQYYSKATAEIHANEALRRQDVGEARAAANALTMQAAYGLPIAPEQVESVAGAFRAAGAPGEAARFYATNVRRPLNDDFGRQPLGEQTRQLNDLRAAPNASSPGEARLITNESGGNPGKVNQLGYAGLYQFGAPLLKDLGLYTPGAGENVNDRNAQGQWSGQKWSGTFAIPGHPEVKTVQDFLANPAAQKEAFDLHTASMDKAISDNGLDRFIGTNVGGVPITREGLHAMIHLGGVEGTVKAVQSGGTFNPTDANGTSLMDYARLGGNAAQPNPASMLWLQANRANTVKSNARAGWSAVMADYDKTGIRPSDATINTIVNAARATNDHDLLEGIGLGVDRMDAVQNVSRRSLAEQHSAITNLEAAGTSGALTPGMAGVLKDLVRKNEAITKGLAENPISTTVTNFSDKFNAPPPLDLKSPETLPQQLQARAPIAQFAQQNWGGVAVSALDKPDLQQVQAALDTPDPAIKAQIFQAISTLPEDVRNATLAKIGEKRPDFMVAAAAGGLMPRAPDVAQSILRGQAALKADKGYLPDAPGQKEPFAEKLDATLPAGAFSLAGRSDPSGPYAVAQGMVKARYADLSAQAADTSGKLNEPRLQQSVDDVTGGILNHNGGSLIAPQRGMSQSQFDLTMNGLTDNDFAGVQTLNGAPVTADYVRSNAQLESVGDGKYQVRLGKDPLHPIYAYQGNAAHPEVMPQKFVLDLRNRTTQASQPTGAQVVSAVNAGAPQ